MKMADYIVYNPGNDLLFWTVLATQCLMLIMWVMYWMRKENKVKKKMSTTGCCRLQKLMLTYGENDDVIV